MPSADVVAKALERARRSAASHDYFFSRLETPDWLEPLAAAGDFDTPAPVLRGGDNIRFPAWAQASYLFRVSALAPERVEKIAMKVKLGDNERVHVDLARAALNFASPTAAAWAKREISWLETCKRLYLNLPEALGRLAANLVERGQQVVALKLL